MLNYEIKNKINYEENADKKWIFLQYVYELFSEKEFKNEPVKIVENNGLTHTIYRNLTKQEFVLYLYFLDIKEAKLRGKNADCLIDLETGDIKITFYDKLLAQDIEDVVNKMKEITFDEMPQFDLRMYFFVPGRDSEFFYQFISFVYYLAETDVPTHGIKICDAKGEFQTYNSLKFPHENLDKFLYYDGNIFIGSHSQNNMIIVYNLPRNKLLELRQWCNMYEG